jgi:hypothetical protein
MGRKTDIQIRDKPRRFPLHFWAGVALVFVWWPVAWLQIQPYSDNYFLPLWLGYILTVDGIVCVRTGTSLIQRNNLNVMLLFVLSVPLWWVFEALNQVLQNWTYHLPSDYSSSGYALRASLAFSTVVPAMFVTTELVQSFRLDPIGFLPRLRLSQTTLIALHASGWAMLLGVLLLPEVLFPLAWISLFFLIDPIATMAGGPSIGSYLRRGDWSPVFNVAAGTLVCGFFWELWNYFALPKWTYSIPYLDSGHIFEMPVAGYGGYIPFGLEVYAVAALLAGLASRFRCLLPAASSKLSN